MNKNWRRQFYSLWFGQTISILTSAILQMALIWHLSLKTGSAAVLSLASLAAFLPTAVLGMFAGVFVDRWNRKLTMIGADLFIAAVSSVLVVYGLLAQIPVWLVLVILFVRSIGTAFHTPAINAVTPLIVPKENLTKCSGFTQSLVSVGYMVGTAVAAVLYPIWSMSWLVMLDVIGAVTASVITAFVDVPKTPIVQDAPKTKLLFEMKEGYKAIKKNKGVFALLWIGAVFMVFYSPINALFPLMSFQHFGGTTIEASVAEIAFSVGVLVGGVILGIWGGLKNRGLSIASTIALMGLAIGISGLLPSDGYAVFAVMCVIMGVSVPFYSGPQMALMQEKIEPQYLGRVFGLYGSVVSLAMPLGLALSGLFADKVGVGCWFMLSGAACVLLALAAFGLKSVRNIEQKS